MKENRVIRVRIRNYISVEFFIVLLYLILDLVQVLILISFRTFTGDFFPFEVGLSNKTIWFLFFIQVIIYIITFKFYSKFIKRRYLINVTIGLNKNLYKAIDYYFLIILLIYIMLFLSGHITPAEAHRVDIINSIISNTIPLGTIWQIYFFLNRGKGNKMLYFFNNMLFTFFSLATGWTGFLFYIFVFELYFRCKQKIELKYFLFTPIAFLFGAFLYQYIYPFKETIRTGAAINLNIQPIPFEISTSYLLSRLSVFSNIVAAVQYKEKILIALNYIYDSENFLILRIFNLTCDSSWISNALKLMVHSVFTYLGYASAVFKDGYVISSEHVVSFGSPFLSVAYLLLSYNILQFILYILVLVSAVLFIKGIFDIFKDRNVYFIFFLNLIYFVHESGEISIAFFRQVIAYFIFFLILLLLKTFQNILKNRRKGESGREIIHIS